MRNLLATTALAIATAFSTAAHAETTLVYGSWWPSNAPASVAFEDFAKKVSETTDGTVNWEFHHDGQVSTLRTGLQSLNSGLIDIGMINGIAHAAQMPIEAMFLDHAAQPTNPYAMSGALLETALDCAECRDEMSSSGLIRLGYGSQDSYYLMCRDEITDASWFNGKSVRGVAAFSRLPESLGANPVYTQPTEVYEAMQRGQVDCVIAGGVWLKTYSLSDVVEVVYDFPLGQANNDLYAVSRETWESLDPEVRKAIVDNLPYLITRNAELQVAQTIEAREYSESQGVRWLPLPDDVQEHYAEFAKQDPMSVAEKASEAGVEDPTSILEKWAENVDKWNGRFTHEADVDAYAQALQQELFQNRQW